MAKTYMRAPSGEVFETSHPEYHKECENLGGGAKGYAARQEYARKELRRHGLNSRPGIGWHAGSHVCGYRSELPEMDYSNYD